MKPLYEPYELYTQHLLNMIETSKDLIVALEKKAQQMLKHTDQCGELIHTEKNLLKEYQGRLQDHALSSKEN